MSAGFSLEQMCGIIAFPEIIPLHSVDNSFSTLNNFFQLSCGMTSVNHWSVHFPVQGYLAFCQKQKFFLGSLFCFLLKVQSPD